MEKKNLIFIKILMGIGFTITEALIIMAAYYGGWVDGSVNSTKKWIQQIKEAFPELDNERRELEKKAKKKRKHLYVVK